MKRILGTTTAMAIAASLFVLSSGNALAQEKSTQAAPAGKTQRGAMFVDKDGDGVCDNYGTHAGKQGQAGMRKGHGPGNGTGNMGVGPKDGTGYGAKANGVTGNGTGVCDGTGPKGYRGGKK